MKVYLGDGVYVENYENDSRITLTTEDGRHEKDRIVLEYDVWVNLKNFMEKKK